MNMDIVIIVWYLMHFHSFHSQMVNGIKVVFGVDNSSSAHVDNIRKYFAITNFHNNSKS